jgi:Double-GTPase 2
MSAELTDPDPTADETENSDPISELVHLSSGNELDIPEAEAITASRSTQLIVIVGPVDCGKTTLVTSIYESFQWGEFAGHHFGGSDTLRGFERRCFLSRAASRREEPETGRTPLGEPAFLHIRVRAGATALNATDLLLTDISGEAFRLARDHSDECKRLDYLGRADHVVFLIDGKKLAAPRTRWSVAQDAISLLQAFLDNEMLPATALIEVFFSKWDYVLRSPDRVALEAHAEVVARHFTDRFATRLGRLRFERIAARPRGNTLPFAFGLAPVLQDWLSTSSHRRSLKHNPCVQGTRESERFLMRQLGEVLTQPG